MNKFAPGQIVGQLIFLSRNVRGDQIKESDLFFKSMSQQWLKGENKKNDEHFYIRRAKKCPANFFARNFVESSVIYNAVTLRRLLLISAC